MLTAYKTAVGHKWVSPAEFWQLCPGEFWWMMEAHKEAAGPGPGLSEEDREELLDMLNRAKAEWAANG